MSKHPLARYYQKDKEKVQNESCKKYQNLSKVKKKTKKYRKPFSFKEFGFFGTA